MATLKEHWEEQIRYFDDTIEDTLEERATTWNARVLSCRDEMTTAQDECLRLDREVAAKRRELAEASPSDGAAILVELRDLSVDHRRAQAKILELSEQVVSARAELAATFAALERERKRRAEAEKALAAATAEEKIRASAREKLALPPLVTLVADAEAAKTGQKQQDAIQVVKGISDELLALADEQYERERKRVANARLLLAEVSKELDATRASTEGVAGEVAAPARAFRVAERTLLRFTGQGQSEFQRALSLLDGLSPSTAILSEAEAAEVVADPGRISASARASAMAKAASDVDDATEDYNEKLLSAQALTPFDVVSSDAVVQAQAELTAKQDELTAERALMVPLQTDLDHWTRIVPDTAWRKLRDYFDARAILDELSEFPPTALADLDAAESAYAAALAAEVAAQRTRAFLEDREAVAKAQLAVLEKQSGIRLISAMRCDFIGTPPPVAEVPDEETPTAAIRAREVA